VKLRTEGIFETEISRQLQLIRSNRTLLDTDYWNRFYLDDKSNFS
jgi:hypothetical protein